ncbi:MAG: class I SAM-dependent methyltransferase [Cenarchaeum sp. SB0667_bin_13]|nr:class I SAM-dependent methyltransferase [Cenarchaeum sp. SB0667_bin_13]MXY37810.1 class I SAM-dependent methyltransferase [Cenarchaeum sp. SB0664_bin_35]
MVSKIFDRFVVSGREKTMTAGHQYSIYSILKIIPFDKPFSFLDVGCGSGWLVRHIADNPYCTRAVGIDKSSLMIQSAKKRQKHPHEEYYVMSLDEWESGPFDLVFSMESLYYAESVPDSISKIYSMLSVGGRFACGTDYYVENPDTIHWADDMPITMHLYSESEWTGMFTESGFDVFYGRSRQSDSPIRWKREQGTLFIIGTKDAHT